MAVPLEQLQGFFVVVISKRCAPREEPILDPGGERGLENLFNQFDFQMGCRQVQLMMVETVPASQIAPVRQVQEDEVQHAGSVERIDVPVVKPEFDFLHGHSLVRNLPRRVSQNLRESMSSKTARDIIRLNP